MTVTTTPSLLTADEFARRPERRDGWQEELVRGEIVVTPPPAHIHGRCQVKIAVRLDGWAESQRRGTVTSESGMRTTTDPDSVRAPDVAYWSAERLPPDVVPAVYPNVAADLCVEILSPGNRERDIDEKIREYLTAGVRVVWVVDPEAHTVTVYRQPDAGQVLNATAMLTDDEVLPGFSCRVSEFFA
jgi:Uma2 family endonuclease